MNRFIEVIEAKMLKKLLRIIFFLSVFLIFLFFALALPIHALEFVISSTQVVDQELTIDVSLSGVTSSNCPNSKCYLQGVLRSVESTYYFGETQNKSGNWIDYSGSYEKDYIVSNFFDIEIKDASWSGQLKMRYKPDDPNYKGPGRYDLKIRRYTGNSTSQASEVAAQVDLTVALPTAEPTATPESTTTSTPTPAPTATKTPSPIPTKTPTPKPTPSSTPEEDQTEVPTQVLTPTPGATVLGESTEKKGSILPYLLIGAGVICLGFAGYFLYNKSKLSEIN